MGEWRIELSKEIKTWYAGLGIKERAQADRTLDLLEDRGPALRMPHSKALSEGLRELRFTCGDHAQRITYYFDSSRAAICLTAFVKQKNNERGEVQRALRAMWKSKGGSK